SRQGVKNAERAPVQAQQPSAPEQQDAKEDQETAPPNDEPPGFFWEKMSKSWQPPPGFTVFFGADAELPTNTAMWVDVRHYTTWGYSAWGTDCNIPRRGFPCEPGRRPAVKTIIARDTSGPRRIADWQISPIMGSAALLDVLPLVREHNIALWYPDVWGEYESVYGMAIFRQDGPKISSLPKAGDTFHVTATLQFLEMDHIFYPQPWRIRDFGLCVLAGLPYDPRGGQALVARWKGRLQHTKEQRTRSLDS
ncbi:MAG: hypothetical protein ABIH03_01375, partial [Pseudomonadota bacterium]